MRNIEIKARLKSIDELKPRVASLSTEGPIEIFQDDTFFNCEKGRLKLRAFPDNKGELIFYKRPDKQGPKESFYFISHTSEPDTLRECLTLAYGQSSRIEKHRTLFMIGRTRVHLDKVKGLGYFLELEVVLNDNETSETGVQEAYDIMEKLGIEKSQLIEGAYVDLLTSK